MGTSISLPPSIDIFKVCDSTLFFGLAAAVTVILVPSIFADKGFDNPFICNVLSPEFTTVTSISSAPPSLGKSIDLGLAETIVGSVDLNAATSSKLCGASWGLPLYKVTTPVTVPPLSTGLNGWFTNPVAPVFVNTVSRFLQQ